jgi:hypothetical protein
VQCEFSGTEDCVVPDIIIFVAGQTEEHVEQGVHVRVLQAKFATRKNPGSHPAIGSYNPSVVKITTQPIEWRVFRTKNIFRSCKNTLTFYNTGVVAANSKVVGLAPGSNPTIVSHNPSVAKNYNATSSLVRFANENIFLLF